MSETNQSSKAKQNNESEQKLPDPSKNDHMDEEVGEEGLTPLVMNPLVEQDFEIQAHAFGHTSKDQISTELIAQSDDLPAEVKEEAKGSLSVIQLGNGMNNNTISDIKVEPKAEVESIQLQNGGELLVTQKREGSSEEDHVMEAPLKKKRGEDDYVDHTEDFTQSIAFDPFMEGEDSGTEEQQSAFMKELENFHKENNLEFKPPKFYGEGLNCLKLWRQVTGLGGYEQVTSCKLWRQVGESFKPPKTCTTVSWSFRIFYEKALLEYEKHKICTGQLQVPILSLSEPLSSEHQLGGNQSSGSGRTRRDAAARAMQGWHSQRLLGNGEVGDPIIKDKSSVLLSKRDKHLKSIGEYKKKKASSHAIKITRTKVIKSQADPMVVDIGAPADWVKINVRRTKDCFEVYALVPGLLREEVHVQSDPAGRLVISGEPEQPDNPWGVTPFKKVINLPSRIDPHQTSAVVTLHGQLFVRAPFEHSNL